MVRNLSFVAIFLSASFAASFATAEEIGRTTIGGRTAVIDSNGTWVYADGNAGAQASNATCETGSKIKSKKLPISFCVYKPWGLDSTPPSSMEFQAVNSDLDLYFGLITERTQMDLAGLKDAILYNAASASGLRSEDVPILKESKETINGVEWNYMEYDIAISGGNFRFGNYFVSLGDRGAVQAAFWSSRSFFETNKPGMIAMMNKVVLEK
jgi:hypothetical protein